MILVFTFLLFSHLFPSLVQSNVVFNYPPESPDSLKILGEDLDAFIEYLLDSWGTPGGLSVAVVQQDPKTGTWTTETKGYGIATRDGAKVDEHSLFAIGSNSKLFAAIAAGLALTNQSLSWETKIAQIVPDWDNLVDPYATKEATVIDLMSHRTGIPAHDFSYEFENNLSDTLRILKVLKPSASFRTTWQYNNIQYTLLSYLPTLLLPSHPSFISFVRERIFVPLGLVSTTYSYEEARTNTKGSLADGFTKTDFNPWEDPFAVNGTRRVWPYWDQGKGQKEGGGNALSGPGGIISSAHDLTVWLKTLILGGAHPETGEEVIPSAVLNVVSTGHSIMNGIGPWPEMGPRVYGGGLYRSTYRGLEFLTHDGGVPGFRSGVFFSPSGRLGIAVLTNDERVGQILHQTIIWRIVEQVIGSEYTDWNGRYHEIVETVPKVLPKPQAPPTTSKPPTLPVAELAGVYEGYKKRLELCAVSPTSSSVVSSNCDTLVTNLNKTIPGILSREPPPDFIISVPSPWVTHVALTHYDGNVFNGSAFSSVADLVCHSLPFFCASTK
ncbi:beta-lactamase/transpeptidase-like protein [Flagelloscypha sp. PMI_526]|nr:beta-lactamase/transpeptidase-like protein [Flagelloscypha sp. PMI_526]